MALLECRALNKHFGGLHVTNSVDLALEPLRIKVRLRPALRFFLQTRDLGLGTREVFFEIAGAGLGLIELTAQAIDLGAVRGVVLLHLRGVLRRRHLDEFHRWFL